MGTEKYAIFLTAFLGHVCNSADRYMNYRWKEDSCSKEPSNVIFCKG